MADHIIQGGCKVAKGERMWWIISFRGCVKWPKVRECGGSYHSGVCVKWPKVRECGGSYSFRGGVKWPKVRECGGSYHSGGV